MFSAGFEYCVNPKAGGFTAVEGPDRFARRKRWIRWRSFIGSTQDLIKQVNSSSYLHDDYFNRLSA